MFRVANWIWTGYDGHMAKTSNPIQVFLADDHTVVRAGIRQFLEEDDGIKVMAEASNGQELLDLLDTSLPDVVVLDIQMPVLNGIQTTREIRARKIPVGILILTAYDDPPYVQALLQAGANGYVLKTADLDEIIQGVKDVFDGKRVVDSVLRESIFESTGRSFGDSAANLSERELEVLRKAASGLTNKAIAVDLDISMKTVQNHLAHIFTKLNTESRTAAVMKAVQLGLIDLDGDQNGPAIHQ